MITQHDLHDIAFAWTIIRDDIECEINSIIISKIEQGLRDNMIDYKPNQIRTAIASIKNLNPEKWHYVYHNNLYVDKQIIKNDSISCLLFEVCVVLKQLLEQQNFKQAYDMIDCCHCLPTIIAINNAIPRSYWKTNVKKYRKKWDKDFLKKQQVEMIKLVKKL